MIRRALFALVVALVCAFASVAAADASDDAARIKKEADALAESDRYAEAAELYEKGYGLSADPVFLYNEGRMLEALGEYPGAIKQLERFRSLASPALLEKTPGLEEHINELKGRVATLYVSSNVNGARLLVRDKQVGILSPDARVQLRAGPATIEIVADGYLIYRRELNLVARESTHLDVALERETPAPRPAEGEQKKGLLGQWWFWTAVGAVVVAGAITTTALAVGGGSDPASGDFQPGRVSAGLHF